MYKYINTIIDTFKKVSPMIRAKFFFIFRGTLFYRLGVYNKIIGLNNIKLDNSSFAENEDEKL